MIFRRLSIAGIVIISLVVVSTLFLISLGGIYYKTEKDQQWQKLRDDLAMKTDQLSAGVTLAAWNINHLQIEAIMESVMQEVSIYGIEVKISAEESVVHARTRNTKWEIIVTESVLPGERLLVEERPISFSGEEIGTVKIFVTPMYIEKKLRENLNSTIFIVISFNLLLILSLYLLLWRTVLGPLKLIDRYAGKVSSGKRATLQDSIFQGELENLRFSIQKMVGLLDSRYEELRESEQRFRVLVEHAPEAILVIDVELNRFIDCNTNAELLLGCNRIELLRSDIRQFSPFKKSPGRPEIESLSKKTSRVLAGESLIFESTIHNVQDKGLLCEVRLVALPSTGRELIRASIIDITERQLVAQRLSASEAHLRTLVQAIPDLVWLKNPEGVFLDCNAKFERLYGAAKRDIVGKTDYDFVDSDLADFFREHDHKAALAGKPSSNEEWVTFADDGHRALLDTIKTPMLDSEGELIGILGIGHDITDRERARKALQLSEERLQLTLDATSIGIWDWDIITNSWYASPIFYSMLGCEPGSGPGERERLMELVHPEDKVAVSQEIEKVLNGKSNGYKFEVRMKHADGSYRWHSVVGQAIDWKDNKPSRLIGVRIDITDRKKAEGEKNNLEEQLHQAQKMESIGRLAGGVAHDFNNMLGVILGYTEIALEKVPSQNPLHADLEEILKAAHRSADITRQLLAFARKQTIAPAVVNLNEAVESMLKMLRRLIGEDIDLVWLPAEDLWSVMVDLSQLDQILANLCINARDAISDVGKVTIETKNRIFDEDYCATHADFIPGEYVMLALSDNGRGMDKETVARIFEPFFTTKDVGQGTGLGLSTIYGIVRQNDGFINVYSECGQGTTFTIYLARHEGTFESIQEEASAEPSVRRQGTILLVEDELSILVMTKKMLEMQGYGVWAASTPSEAIRLAKEQLDQIDLLVTDVVMPEMNGRDLAKQLVSLHPNLKCLFMSGYTANVIAHHGVLDRDVDFIQKPFSKKSLAIKVQDVISSV